MCGSMLVKFYQCCLQLVCLVNVTCLASCNEFDKRKYLLHWVVWLGEMTLNWSAHFLDFNWPDQHRLVFEHPHENEKNENGIMFIFKHTGI